MYKLVCLYGMDHSNMYEYMYRSSNIPILLLEYRYISGTTATCSLVGLLLSIFFYYDPISSASVPALSMSMHPPCMLSNLVAARTGLSE